VWLNSLVSSVVGEDVQLKDGTVIRAATLVWAAGVQAPALIEALDTPKARGGRVNVAPDLSLPDHPEVFVVGDMAYREQDGQAIPQLAQPAIQGGRYVAEVIVKQRERGEQVPPYEGSSVNAAIETHERLGLATLLIFGSLTLWRWRSRRRGNEVGATWH